jgi:hypothetical protein
MSFARQLRRHAIELGAVLCLVVCAGAVGAYVLAHQRVRFPWQHVYTIKADFTSAAAVAPGQGQTVDVAGVKVGEIGKVTLHDGHARIELQIRRDKLPAVYSDARALLRPKTGLQDMSVDLDPGTSRAHKLGDGDVDTGRAVELSVGAGHRRAVSELFAAFAKEREQLVVGHREQLLDRDALPAAPIVRTGTDGLRELVTARWGMPTPPKFITGKADRVGFRVEDGKKVRYFKSTKKTIDA